MPVSGETKWVTLKEYQTKEDLEEELGIVEGTIDWANKASIVMAFAGNLSLWLGLAGLGAISAQIYYNDYKAQLEEVLADIEDLPDGTPFEVQQKFRWHAGKRSWTPVNDLRLVA